MPTPTTTTLEGPTIHRLRQALHDMPYLPSASALLAEDRRFDAYTRAMDYTAPLDLADLAHVLSALGRQLADVARRYAEAEVERDMLAADLAAVRRVFVVDRAPLEAAGGDA